MNTKDVDTIIDALRWRYATKIFNTRAQITNKDWHTIKQSLRLSPSSFGLQPWKFIEVESGEIKQSLADCVKLNAPKILTSSKLIVIAGLKHISTDYLEKYFNSIVNIRQIEKSSIEDFSKMLTETCAKKSAEDQAIWINKQAYIALGSAITTAALLGIDSCPMEGINRNTYDEILGLATSDYTSLVALAFGYRSENDDNQKLTKVRFSEDDIFEKK
ncbi:NAD(P)H-dependent oxidoreductase [Agarilytica rhodophyticola]|uniref:NAD(P)H-dependent oxidoreductase n=1 Tax=Agarilytica rhodophyticola TaxID=1737490 RepID=UPI000B343485|nr:NAD(P)H-dependent oxidoreductase [Agarilytica rhodophyticola]